MCGLPEMQQQEKKVDSGSSRRLQDARPQPVDSSPDLSHPDKRRQYTSKPSPFTPESGLSVVFCFPKVTVKYKHRGNDLIFAKRTHEVYISWTCWSKSEGPMLC